jgi:putative pyruvate formate lyase activating enzyme
MEKLRLLEGIFDIYMPDAKYGSDEPALKYSLAPQYMEAMKSALREMHRQVGDLVLDEEGIAVRGLLVRHLILPAGLAGTAEVIRFLASEVSRNTYLNIMPQFRPEYKACRFPELSRPITGQEYIDALRLADRAGLTRGLAIL